LLGHEGEVEADTNEIALCTIVIFIIVIINNHVLTIDFACRYILEVIQIEGVGQDIVGVGALERLALGLISSLKSCLLLIGE